MYAQKFDCPECSKPLSQNARKCACGWEKLSETGKKDHRCNFILDGERCNLPGSMSPSVLKSDDWVCAYHFQYRDDYRECARWVQFIKKFYQEIIHYRSHYQTNYNNCERCAQLKSDEKSFSDISDTETHE
jgi:hypothetical protein